MKAIMCGWILVMGVLCAQNSEEEVRFFADYRKSEALAVAAFPDAAKFDTKLSQKMMEIDQSWKKADDQRYYSPDKPMMIAEIAAKELGISPATPPPPALAQEVASPPSGAPGQRSDAWLAKKDEAWRLMSEYYPEYCDPALMSQTYKFVKEWDAWAKVNNPDVYENPMKPLIYAKWQKAAEIEAKKQQEEESARLAQEAANRPPPPAPVWKRFVKNSEFQRNNRDAIAGEIRQQNGDEAAQQFLREVPSASVAEQSNEPETHSAPAAGFPSSKVLEGGSYRREGNRITRAGNLSDGYEIRGGKLYSLQTGAPTHTRSGGMWTPLDGAHERIWDPE